MDIGKFIEEIEEFPETFPQEWVEPNIPAKEGEPVHNGSVTGPSRS